MASLFGNLGNQTTSQPSSGGSLFGNLNTPKPAAQTGSLFGSTLGTNSQPPTSGLFGSSQATSSAQPAGGLFGAVASQPQQGNSLFSAPATSTPQSGSLFGNTQSAQGGSSIFGNTQSAQGGGGSSLFGNTQSAQGGGGLFGNTGNNQQQSNQGGNQGNSLFGNTQTTQTGSLFGSQPGLQNSMFGNTQQAQNIQNPQNVVEKKDEPKPALFDSLLEKGRKRKVGESSLEGLPSIELGIGDIRQRIKIIHSGGQGTASAGTAHYLLAGSGVDPSSTDLSFFDSQATSKPRAELRPEISVSGDTDVDSYLANIQTQTTLSMISDGLARSVQDFDTFLEDNVSMEWDAQRKRIYDHFGIKPKDESSGVNSSFGGSSFGRSAFGRSSRQNNGTKGRTSQAPGASTIGRQSMQRSVIGTPGPVGLGRSTSLFSDIEKQKETSGSSPWIAPDNPFLQRRQKNFIDVVNKFNSDRTTKTPYAVFSEFRKITAETGDQQSQNVADAYEAMKIIVNEQSDSENLSRLVLRERSFSNLYLNEATTTSKTIPIKKTILTGANKYLEMKFYRELQEQIDRNPREASMGGIPDVISRVKGYIRTLVASKNLHRDTETLQSSGDDYPWAIVFYLIRSGHLKEAAQYVDNEVVTFRSIDRYFSLYIHDYAHNEDRRLSRPLQERINNSYNQLHRVAPDHTIDPFKLACYKIIGRCDLEDRKLQGLIPNIDDFIWLQFNLAREVSRVNEMATEVYGLDEVRMAIIEIGTRHFTAKTINDKNRVYGMYFYLQILCGLFEQAVAYLYPFNHVDAVHFAIALSYYGLLRVSTPGTTTDLLSFSTRQEPQLNFGPMVAYYTRDFRAADAIAAVDYIVMICLNADLPGDIGRQHANLCHEALRELVLESREFAELLGDIRYDGQRIRGAIEERRVIIGLEDGDDFLRSVTISAANLADDSGRVIDAVLLYHLAREYDLVLAIINRALSEAINVDIGQDPLRLQPLKPRDNNKSREPNGSSLSLTSVDDPAELARTILELYKSNPGVFRLKGDVNKNNCEVLLKMNDAKKQVQEAKWTMALDVSCFINF